MTYKGSNICPSNASVVDETIAERLLESIQEKGIVSRLPFVDNQMTAFVTNAIQKTDLDLLEDAVNGEDQRAEKVNSNLLSRITREDVEKMHRQFSHASDEKIERALRLAGMNPVRAKDLTLDPTKQCDICNQMKQPPPRPVVSSNVYESFNDTIEMDL